MDGNRIPCGITQSHMYETQLKLVYHQFQSISYGRVKMMYHQIPSNFRCTAHGTLRYKYETYSIACIKCGAEEFTQKFPSIGQGTH